MTYKLFANCFPVKGFAKSIIMDIQRKNYENIPNSLYEILIENDIIDFQKLKVEYNNKAIINEYKKLLLYNEFIFECSEKNSSRFPKIETTFESPFYISNAVIELSDNYNVDLKDLKKSFDNLGIQSVYLISYKNDFETITDFLKVFDDSRLIDIQILLPYNEKYNEKLIKLKKNIFRRITSIIFHTAPKNSRTKDCIKTSKIFTSFNFCGAIKGYFTVNENIFYESLHHNSCLNKKLSIDKDGNIKNCPSMVESFGNIADTTLEEAINKPGFKKYWNLTKDQIEICKDCEFRYICTDCRAYTEQTHTNEGGLDISKPLKCGYNPYTNIWEEWSTHPLKQKAIDFYNMHEIIENK